MCSETSQNGLGGTMAASPFHLMRAVLRAIGATALAAVPFSNSSSALAQDATWALLHQMDDVFVLVNTDVVPGNRPAAWMSVVYKPGSVLPDGKSALILEQSEFNCAKRAGGVKYRASYDAQGQPLGGQSVYEVDHPFVPGTVGDALMRFACGFGKPPRPTIVSPQRFRELLDVETQSEANLDAEYGELTDEAVDAAAYAAEKAAEAAAAEGAKAVVEAAMGVGE